MGEAGTASGSVGLLGIDVGGTFTDAVFISPAGLFRAKVPTTAEQSEGVLEAAFRVLGTAGAGADAVTYFAHGMTTATNALLERKGARTASIATEGFRDILEIGRQNRPRLYDLCPQRPEALVGRELRRAVRERVSAGGVVVPLDDDEVTRIVHEIKELRVEAVAVCLLFSFLDSTHERRLGEALARALPGVHVSLSSMILPQFREYERFSTTAVDAYLTPVVARYLLALKDRVERGGLPQPAIMQSSGGVLPLEAAADSAAPLLLSGPAAGVVGAIHAGTRGGVDDLIAFDMGGTSTDVSLVRARIAGTAFAREVGGQPVALPMVDIHTIGAGGGSIAWVDAGGALRVGPASAGADPGPACYGRGGREATVSDADCLLGYLGERLGGGSGLLLDREAARAAIAQLGERLGIGPEEAAMGIRRVAGSEMVKAVRVISVERGHDPRRFVLVAFGGAGPMHAAGMAAELGIATVMVPESCGVLSALGMVVGDERRDFVRTVLAAGGCDEDSLTGAFTALEAEHAGEIGLPGTLVERRADMRYRGQSHELTVDAGRGGSRDELVAAFEAEHENLYGYRAPGEPVELVNIRLVVRRPLPVAEIRSGGPGGGSGSGPGSGSSGGADDSPGGGRPAFREMYFRGRWVEGAVWRRLSLAGVISGPAIVEDEEATTVLPPGWTAELDAAANLWLRDEEGGE